jgi:hypothetical protein
LLMLLSTVPMVDASDYDSDGTPDSSDTDDDNDGVLDSLDSCSQGTTGWTSTNITDRDGDGCKDILFFLDKNLKFGIFALVNVCMKLRLQ